MLTIKKEIWNHTLLISGEDRVIGDAAVSMDGGKYLGSRGEVKIVSAGDINVNAAVVLMTRGVVVPIGAVGTDGFTADELWDAAVPKDEALDVAAATEQVDMNIGEGAVEAPPFSTPGRINPTILAEGDGIWGHRFFNHRMLMTFADTSDGFKDGTPDTYLPNGVVSLGSAANVEMTDVPGYALMAMGNPSLANTTGTVPSMIFGREHRMLRFLESLLMDSWKLLHGLDEAGAEDPFLTIAQLIVELTEPPMLEETVGAWGAASFNVWTTMQMWTSTPGIYRGPGELSSGA